MILHYKLNTTEVTTGLSLRRFPKAVSTPFVLELVNGQSRDLPLRLNTRLVALHLRQQEVLLLVAPDSDIFLTRRNVSRKLDHKIVFSLSPFTTTGRQGNL
jgi:hypothetical protein